MTLFLSKSFLFLFVVGITLQCSSALPTNIASDYDKACTVVLPNGIAVDKYVSRRTGLSIVVAHVEGPLVSGYFTFATEAKSDDGLPHTLEHLVFLGSELYPYKGVLDLLANKCLASGTNAWTAVDSTTYTMETAGSEGFLNLLPIYFDHMLYPTITDAGFTTEVYHVTGEGQDAGVVYSEMQGRSSSSNDRVHHALMRALYPAPSGYRYDTGGSVINLRNSTTNEKVRAYHKKFYQPENMQVIVIGQIDSDELLSVIHKYEDRIVQKGERPAYERPWQSQVPDLNETIREEVLYPSKEVDTGRLVVAFRGPNIIDDYRTFLSLDILLEYLTYTSVSILPKAFVDRSEPLATSVSYYCPEYKVSSCYLQFSGVPLKSLDEIEPLMYSTLQEVFDNAEGLQISDIKEVLLKQITKIESRLESSPKSIIAHPAIDYGLYGNTCEDLTTRLDLISWYQELQDKSTEFWKDLLKKYVLDSVKVVMKAIPSPEEAKRVAAENKERVENRKKILGEEGLKQKAQELEAAKKINEIPPPPSMLNDMPIPSTDSISFHQIGSYSNHEINDTTKRITDPPKFKISELPFRFQVDDIHSNFVVLAVVMDTSSLSQNQRMYLPILFRLLFETDVVRNGTTETSYTDVIKELSKDFLVTRSSMSVRLSGSGTFSCGSMCNYATIVTKMEDQKFPIGLSWLYDIMYHTKFTTSRIKNKNTKLLRGISSFKRSASSVMSLMNERLLFRPDSNQNLVSFLRQEKFLKELAEKLETPTEAQSVIDDLTEIFATLTDINTVTFHMSGDISKLSDMSDLNQLWRRFAQNGAKEDNDLTLNVVSDNQFRVTSVRNHCPKTMEIKKQSETVIEDQNIIYLNVTYNSTTNTNASLNCQTTAYIKGLPSIESAYLQQSTASIKGYSHEDVPALLAAIKYFTQLEGPMWREIRGKGLAYNYRIGLLSAEGTLTLRLNKAAQIVKAYQETLSLLRGYINGTTAYDQILFDTAKSSLLYGVISRESTVESCVQQSLMSYYRGVSHSYNRDLLPLISNLTLEDIERVTRIYFTPLLTPHLSTTIVVCPNDDVQKINTAMKGFGHEVETVEDIENSIFA